ncbi:hypothetical protein GW7_15318, partial [Heterocephalus glaber]
AGITGVRHHGWLEVLGGVEAGFHCAAQAGLEFTALPPASASQNPGITGVCH